MIVIKKDNETMEQAIDRALKEEAEIDLTYRMNKKYDEKFLYVDGYVKVVIVDGK